MLFTTKVGKAGMPENAEICSDLKNASLPVSRWLLLLMPELRRQRQQD